MSQRRTMSSLSFTVLNVLYAAERLPNAGRAEGYAKQDQGIFFSGIPYSFENSCNKRFKDSDLDSNFEF